MYQLLQVWKRGDQYWGGGDRVGKLFGPLPRLKQAVHRHYLQPDARLDTAKGVGGHHETIGVRHDAQHLSSAQRLGWILPLARFGASLLLAKAAADENLELFLVTRPIPTEYFGKGAMTAQADILLVETAVAHAGRGDGRWRLVVIDHPRCPAASLLKSSLPSA